MRPHPRRRFLQSAVSAGTLSVAALAGLLKPSQSFAWFPFFNNTPYSPARPVQPGPVTATAQPAPQARTPLDMLVRELRQARPEVSTAVDLMSPEIAVDGASIMLDFQALLPDVDGFAVYIEGNPQPLAAAFYLAPEVLPEMKLLVRLAQSSNIAVVARSHGGFYKHRKFVKVTHGGCGDSFEATEAKHRSEVQQRHRSAP